MKISFGIHVHIFFFCFMLVQSSPVRGATLDEWPILVPGQCRPIVGATLDNYCIFKKITGYRNTCSVTATVCYVNDQVFPKL